MLKSFRYILFPISVIYGFIIWLRNRLYDKKILRSAAFNFPVICVGNLALGGTGKTPMTEYLVRLLKKDFRVGTLSRGYKRKTRGFALADQHTTPIDIGDEPMQLARKFPDISVSVAEERLVGIPQLLHARPETQVIILDDAFQHRQVRAGLNILLTEYDNLYTRDFILPAGDLRDVKSSSRRADIIIVTKCPELLSEEKQINLISEIRPLENQQVFFTRIVYESPYHLFTKETRLLEPGTNFLLVCGIANPKPLQNALTAYSASYEIISFKDHHIFTVGDLEEIIQRFNKIDGEGKMILTTEKDGVRLAKFENEFAGLPIYVLPMHHSFLFEQHNAFDPLVIEFISGFEKPD